LLRVDFLIQKGPGRIFFFTPTSSHYVFYLFFVADTDLSEHNLCWPVSSIKNKYLFSKLNHDGQRIAGEVIMIILFHPQQITILISASI